LNDLKTKLQGGYAPTFLDDGYVALEGIMDGLAAGMEVIGDLL